MSDRKTTTIADLMRLRMHDVLIHQVMSAWEHGEFPSLEAALIFLVVEQSRQNANLTTRVVDLNAQLPIPAITVSASGRMVGPCLECGKEDE